MAIIPLGKSSRQFGHIRIPLPPGTPRFGAALAPIILHLQQDTACQKALTCQGLRSGVWLQGSGREARSRPSAYRRVVETGTATRSELSMGSPAVRTQVAQRKDPQRSRITNGVLLPGVDGRSAWSRRAKDVLSAHLSDIPDPTAAERSIIRRASVLTVELEKLEAQFALAGEADAETLDLYGRTSGNLRRLLEAVGISRRDARDVTPDPLSYAREVNIDEGAP